MEHARAQTALGGYVRRRLDRKLDGRWPGGWWTGTELDVDYAAHELYRHDVVGWRRERAPDATLDASGQAGYTLRALSRLQR